MFHDKIFSGRDFGELDKDFVFLHIPKAGGSSLRRFFSILFGQSSVFPEPKIEKTELSSLLNRGRPKVYMKHIDYVNLPDTPMYKATMLRHPVERLLSVYSYSINSGKQFPLIGGIDPNMSLLEFLGSEKPAIRMNVRNAQTWQLGYGYHTRERNAYRAQGGHCHSQHRKKQSAICNLQSAIYRFCRHIRAVRPVPRENTLDFWGKGRETSSCGEQISGKTEIHRPVGPGKKAVEACVRKDVELYDFACKLL